MKFHPKLENFERYRPVREDSRIRLNANESCFGVNKRILAKLKRELDSMELNRYPDPSCTELRAAFGKCFKVKPECVTCGNGSDELLNLICQTFAGKGDRVVTVEPDFSMYSFYAKLMECEVLRVEKGEDLTFDVDEVVETCREQGARILFFSNPCNPTSLLLDKRSVLKLVSALPDTLVVADEAYMEFAQGGSVLAEARKYGNLIVLKTLSKAFGLAGIRLGFAVSQPGIAEILNSARSPYNVNSITQRIGVLALSHRSVTEKAEDILDAKRQLFEGLKALEAEARGDFEVVDGETNFVYIKTSKVKKIDAYLNKRGIAVRSFERTLRITAGTEEENAELLSCLEEISAILWLE